MAIKRAIKAVAFWAILLATASNALSAAFVGSPSTAVATATAGGMFVVLLLWAALLHRIIYGRVPGRTDLERLSPIRPAETVD